MQDIVAPRLPVLVPSEPAPAWFASPSTAFWPSTYWFWHNIPSRAVIAAQLGAMLDAGFRTVLIQARLAFPRELYLGEDHLDAYRFAVGEAKRLGIEVGIYDDYSWMSGHAGGRTVAGHDALRERHLFWTEVTGADGRASVGGIVSFFMEGLGRAGMAWCYEEGRVAWDEWRIVSAVAYPPDIADPAVVREVTARFLATGDEGCEILADMAEVPPDWHVAVFVSARCRTSRLVNYLLPETARRFIEVGYEPYRAAIGDFFGDPVKYMFFDHPYCGFYRWKQHAGDLGNSLLHADRLVAAAAGLGVPYGVVLLSLIRPIGPATTGLRAAYFALYNGMLHQTFLGALSAWTRQHGLGLAGHELLAHVGGWGLADGFPSLDSRTTLGVDYFGVEAFRTHTTVDASNYGPQISARMGDSVARASGRSRCIVEQYSAARDPRVPFAAGLWGLTLEEIRAQALRHHLFGARQFLFHAFYQTSGSDGDSEPFSNPRFDFPPGINFEPWFPLFADFAAESARLSAFMEDAAPLRTVALVYPLSTIWAEGGGHPCNTLFGAWARFLSEEGIGFDVVDDRALAGGVIEEGGLRLRSGAYRHIILPGAAVLPDAATLAALAAFAAGGGQLTFARPVPNRLAESREAGAERGLPLPPGFAGEEATVPGAGWLAAFRAAASVSPDIAVTDALPLWRWAGAEESGWRVAAFNDQACERRVSVTLPDGACAVSRWNPAAGTIEAVPLEGGAGGTRALTFAMEQNELLCLRIEKGRGRPPSVTAAAPAGDAAPGDGFAVALKENWTLRFDDAEPVPVEVDRGWERQGFPTLSGVGLYACAFTLGDTGAGPVPHDAAWELNLPALRAGAAVTLNGVFLGRRAYAPYRYPIPRGLLTAGPNVLGIEVFSTAANEFYAGTPYQPDGPEASGLLAPPVLACRARLGG
ncbi:carbohydrate-binding protein [Labrys monachus]|uniref:Uncharacterized protein n=1 Tax=Labrys monachus TaxID=217067 RepID=A0ABU0F953_9HYPH|nr:carbohydrate-binding protein [Labrys monachus]MDQ0391132.1 hypothetical protein [Labrys monachus]